jgi:dTDP-4-dehydrorhamnose reductase
LKILVTGSSGRLGVEISKVFPRSSRPAHRELDVTDEAGVKKYITSLEPNVLVHAAAMTSIRECEDNQRDAWMTNVQGTSNVIRACESLARKPYFVYLSTACVFRGDRGDYTETDTPYPKNFYALTKLIAEQIVLDSHLKRKLVVRTNFVAREKWPHARAFSDRFGTYLFAEDVAIGIKEVIENRMTGVVHVAGEKKMSMYELAKLNSPDIRPMTMQDYDGPPLTVDMSLRSVRLRHFQITV